MDNIQDHIMSDHSGLNQHGRRMVTREYISRVITGLILFLSSGDWGWMRAWVYVGLGFATILMVHWFVVRKHPELYNERGQTGENAKEWDRRWLKLYVLVYYLSLAVMGLDRRFDWSSLSGAWIYPGALLILASGALNSWAMAENAFFSSLIRIQEERGHRVVTSGPYNIIRHPGYLGGSLYYVGTPMILDSWIGFIFSVLIIGGFAARIRFEEKTLDEELEGYREYTEKVPYRLLPGVW